ncbi:MAG: serine/threonine-protein phosphatase [Clostridiales bacterium]|nr:serine/threonine-protein phosphatase [Clostridiales bacterium]
MGKEGNKKVLNKSSKRSPVAILGAAALLVVAIGGKIYGVSPFGTAMFCALSGCFFIGFIAPVYLLCEFLFSFEVWRLYACGAVIFVMAVRWVIALKVAKFNKGVCKTLFSLFAIIIHTVLSALFVSIADAVIAGFIGCLFYYFSVNVAGCTQKAFSSKLGIVEAASVCVVFLVAGLAFGRARYGMFIIGLAPAMLVVLLLSLVGSKAVLSCGAMIAVGLGYASASLVPAFIMCVITIPAFSRLNRFVYTPTAIGVFAATSVLFFVDPIQVGWNSLMLAAGGLLFCILPRRAVKKVRDYFDYEGSSHIALRHYVNRCKYDAGNRMLAVASVFDETARLMTVMGSPRPDYAAMGYSLSDRICPYCPKNSECDRAAREGAFTLLAERATAGRAILSDLPEFFTASCCQAGEVISASAAITDGARERLKEKESEDKAKAIVTERLTAVKDVLEELGKAEALPVGFDANAEKRVIFELASGGVECADVFVTRDAVTAVVRTNTASHDKIRRAVSTAMKRRYEVVAIEKTQAAGWSVAMLKRRPMYEAVYARAGVAKDGVSGDSYTFKRIGDRFLAALLDGMGSGKTAGESSGAAVELIECFYRAGFDSQSVIAGVNRFLKLPTAENYSAADVAVCDLDNATVDIIKLGAPPCYIKTTDTVLKIEGSSLPIGVLDEMRPYIATKKLYPGQMLILVTDGIADCFDGDELPSFINGLSAFNPETAVTDIVSRALKLSGGTPKDDMTAIAFRLYEKKK